MRSSTGDDEYNFPGQDHDTCKLQGVDDAVGEPWDLTGLTIGVAAQQTLPFVARVEVAEVFPMPWLCNSSRPHPHRGLGLNRRDASEC